MCFLITYLHVCFTISSICYLNFADCKDIILRDFENFLTFFKLITVNTLFLIDRGMAKTFVVTDLKPNEVYLFRYCFEQKVVFSDWSIEIATSTTSLYLINNKKNWKFLISDFMIIILHNSAVINSVIISSLIYLFN